MESTVLLNSNENTRQFEDEEKSRFVRFFLLEFGIPVEGIWDEHEQISPANRIKLQEMLSMYDLEVIGSAGGDLKIYHENVLVAEWRKPLYTLKKDPSQKDPRKKLYLECKLNHWSISENPE